MREEPITIEGTTSRQFTGRQFQVALDNGHLVLATLSGKMNRHKIRCSAGDRVALEMTPYDLTRGRIFRRL